MAPARTTTRRAQHDQNALPRPSTSDNASIMVNDDLFLEPMMGTPLQMYIEKDVEARDALVEMITVRRVLWSRQRSVACRLAIRNWQ